MIDHHYQMLLVLRAILLAVLVLVLIFLVAWPIPVVLGKVLCVSNRSEAAEGEEAQQQTRTGAPI